MHDSSLRVEEDMMFFYVKSIREVLGLPVPGKGSKETGDKEVGASEKTIRRQRHN